MRMWFQQCWSIPGGESQAAAGIIGRCFGAATSVRHRGAEHEVGARRTVGSRREQGRAEQKRAEELQTSDTDGARVAAAAEPW